MKLLRWLKSRPLARVRRTLATRRRIAADQRFGQGFEDTYRRVTPPPRKVGVDAFAVLKPDPPTRAELSTEFKEYYRRYMAYLRRGRATLYDGPIWPEAPGEQHTREKWEKRAAEIDRLIEEYRREQRGE